MSFTKLKKTIFFLTLFLIPSNLAKHYVQDWSLVSGIIVDYLIPTLYLTDLLILSLLGLWLMEIIKAKKTFSFKTFSFKKGFKKNKGLSSLHPFISIILIFLIFFFYQLKVKNSRAGFFKAFKLLEISLFILYIKYHINIKKDIKSIILTLNLAIIWQAFLSILQWLKQGSVFGYWFLGEQPFNAATFNLKLISLQGQLKVLPLGTFPHPNVLAGFLVLSLTLTIAYFQTRPTKLAWLAIILGIITLWLTFSTSAWFVFMFSLAWLFFKNIKSRKNQYLFLTLTLFSFLGLLVLIKHLNFFEASSIFRRLNLDLMAFKMWLSAPLLGVGLNNFTVRIEEFGLIISSGRFLQPVHNAFLLILAETGLIGTMLVLLLFYKILQNKNNMPFYLFLPLVSLLMLSFFDHYWLSLQQGLLMLALILGLVLKKIA